MPAQKHARKSPTALSSSRDGMFVMPPDQHRAVAKDLRRMVNDPKAQRLATAHEQLAVTIQKRLDERTMSAPGERRHPSAREEGRFCALCRVAEPATATLPHAPAAGVGNWPRDEIAEGGAPRVRLALWLSLIHI